MEIDKPEQYQAVHNLLSLLMYLDFTSADIMNDKFCDTYADEWEECERCGHNIDNCDCCDYNEDEDDR